MPINRAWGNDYLQQEYKAMRWLADKGFSLEEIRTMTWGRVDESARAIRMVDKVTTIQLDLETGLSRRDEHEREFMLPFGGTEVEWFFRESRIFCGWMFTRERPRSWRKDKSRDSLFTPVEVKKICGKTSSNRGVSTLTNSDIFANIEVSKLNITKMKTKELVDKARTSK